MPTPISCSDFLRSTGLSAFHRFDSGQLESRNRLRLQFDHSNSVGIGVSDVEFAVGNAQSSGFVEQPAVGSVSTEECLTSPRRGVEQLQLTIVRVGYNEFAFVMGH